ncbi:MAG: glycosyltransferase family 4 protein [Acidobacteriota bacterium]
MPGPAAALYVAFDVFPRAKGSSSHIASMVRGLERVFGSVRLLCLGSPEMPAYQREGNIEIFRFRERRRDLLMRATAFARFVARHTREMRGATRLAVFRDPWGGYPLLRSEPGCRTIFEVNALPSWELGYSRPGVAGDPALMAKLRDMERYCLRGATRVLCVSTVTRQALAGEGVRLDCIDTIPNVAHDAFFNGVSRPCAIPALEDGDWCGYIGGLQAWQGVEGLIDAFALAAPDLPKARLLILHGDTPRAVRTVERRIARSGMGERILLHPPLPSEDVAAVLPRLRFTAVPLADTPRNTVQGCCPIKLVESLAAGTPVVASDLAVCREWVNHEREGLLVAPHDRRAWALSLRRMFRDGELRTRMGSAARRRAEKTFSWQVVHEQLENMFQYTAAGGGRI